MQEEDLNKVAELFYFAYEDKYGCKHIEPEGFMEALEKLLKSLNKEQHKYFDEFEILSIEFLKMQLTRAFKYILEILCPEY